MAPVATSERAQENKPAPTKQAPKIFNPFYSPPGDDNGDENYKFVEFKVSG